MARRIRAAEMNGTLRKPADLLTFVRMAMAPKSSPKPIAIAESALLSLSGSMNDRATTEAVKMPMEMAIFLIVSALMLVCMACREPVNASNDSPTFLRMPPPIPLMASAKPPLTNFLIKRTMPPRRPVWRTARVDWMLAVLKASLIAEPILPMSLTIVSIIGFMAVPIRCSRSRKLCQAPFNLSSVPARGLRLF